MFLCIIKIENPTISSRVLDSFQIVSLVLQHRNIRNTGKQAT